MSEIEYIKEITSSFKNLSTDDIVHILKNNDIKDHNLVELVENIKAANYESNLNISEILEIASNIYDISEYKEILYSHVYNLFYNSESPDLLMDNFKCTIPQEIVDIKTSEIWDWEPSDNFKKEICDAQIEILKDIYAEHKQLLIELDQKDFDELEDLSIKLATYINAYEMDTQKEVIIPNLEKHNKVSNNKKCKAQYLSYKNSCSKNIRCTANNKESKTNLIDCIEKRLNYIQTCANNTIDYNHAKHMITLFKYFQECK